MTDSGTNAATSSPSSASSAASISSSGPVSSAPASSGPVSSAAAGVEPEGVEPGGTEADRPTEMPWRRLSLRMLAVHPVIELVRALPAVVALLIVGSQREDGWWAYIGVGLPVLIGLIRWVSTRYRITPTKVQVRRGLLGRTVRTVPRDRIRTVDLTSHLMHRLLGLTKVAVGTGGVDRQRDSTLVLDGLSKQDAARLREELLHSRRTATPGVAAVPAVPASPASAVETFSASAGDVATSDGATNVAGAAMADTPAVAGTIPTDRGSDEIMLARLDPAWIRYGPFSMSGLLTIIVVTGFAWRTINEADLDPGQLGPLHALITQVSSIPLAWAAVEVTLVGLVLVALASTLAYVMAFWNFALTRTSSGTLHVSRGLLTTRSITIEERRLRGVEINEPLLLRAVNGARCSAITTGLRYGRGAERGGSLLLPPAPLAEARRVGAHVLRTSEPLTAPLIGHSRAAARRRYTRALLGGAVLIALVGVLSWAVDQPAWVVAAAVVVPPSALLLAKDRFRSLGHAIVDNRLVFRVGSVVRRRNVIDSDGVIGWKIGQSFFQRRSGLVTLTATTAAGRQYYPLPDVDSAEAIDLADTVLPGLLTPFLVRQP